MTKRAALALIAVLGIALLIPGLVLGLSGVQRDGVACGSAFGGTSNNGEVRDLTNAMEGAGLTSVASDCSSAVSDRKPTATALTVAGGILLVVGAVGALASGKREPVASGIRTV